MHRNRLLPFLAALVLIAPAALAQGVTGSAMTGNVTDKGGVLNLWWDKVNASVPITLGSS